MAIEYGMTLNSDCSGRHLAGLIARSLSVDDFGSDDGVAVVDGGSVEVRVIRVSGASHHLRSVEGSRAKVLFRLNKFGLPSGREEVAKAVAEVLKSVSGDMVLTWNWEMVIAVRTGDDLLISEESDLVSVLIDELTVPYRLGAIPTRP